MFHKAATIKQVCDYYNGNKGSLPIIVNTQNTEDYRAVLDRLVPSGFLRVSAYFDGLPFPNISKMRADLAAAKDGTVVLGLSHSLAFNGGVAEITNALADIINSNCKVFVLSYGLADAIEKKLHDNVRLKTFAEIFLVKGQDGASPRISLTAYDHKTQNYYSSLKEYFFFLEENGSGYGVIKSDLHKEAFDGGIYSVSEKNSAFELLKEIDDSIAGLDESDGTNEQWETLLKDLEGKPFKNFMLAQLIDLVAAIKKLKTYSDTQKWRVFLWLKAERGSGYLSLVAKELKTPDDIISAIYCAILEIEPRNKSFVDYYQQRKVFIVAIDDTRAIKEFVKRSNARGKDKVLYFTDATEIERKEIIKCFSQYDYSIEEMRKISQTVYPLLGEYLSPFMFNNEILNGYFEEYKFQKLSNILTDDFKAKVDANARMRSFYELPARATALSRVKADDAIVYWVDALGVEFCGYIIQRCKHYGVSAKIQAVRAELPTLTKFNNDFSPFTTIKPIKDLDTLKHAGENDHDFEKSPLPLYIESELLIIDDIIKKAAAAVSGKKKVIILSDHGASRLVRLANNILTITVDTKEGEKDEKHGGRCCAWNSDIPKQYDTVTDSDNNGFCVIANYDRFKGGKYTGVELHGGATLEEVVVPIIEITEKVTTYRYTLKSAELKLRGRQAESLIISLSSEVGVPRIKIDGQNTLIAPIEIIDESTYTFETNITKSGKYKCTFFDDNEEIIQRIEFEVKSALGAINDPLQ